MKKWFLIPLVLVLGACNVRSVTIKTVDVAAQTKPCVLSIGGLSDPSPNTPSEYITNCIQVRDTSINNTFHHNSIVGFTHEPGFQYKLRVYQYGPMPYVQDDFGYLEFISVLEKTPAT
jgi:hypothetical protein